MGPNRKAKKQTVETRPARIRKLAREREEVNVDFRAFLKNGDLKPGCIDQIVQRLNEDVCRRIDCRTCANCCLETTTEVTGKDIERLVPAVGLRRDAFIAKYLDYNEEEGSYWLKGPPCPFLVDKTCSVYVHRPDICRSYPHLHQKDFIGRTLNVLDNVGTCPIVFNVYEQLKDRLADPYEEWVDAEGEFLDR